MIKLTKEDYNNLKKIRNNISEIYELLDTIEETNDNFYVDAYASEGIGEFAEFIDTFIYNYKK